MRRRECLALLGGGAMSWPFSALAQKKIHRIGVLLLGGPQPMGPYREALRDLGYVEGRNVQFEVRSAQGQANRLPDLAAELVRGKVDIILASFTPAVTAARRATSDIPIVMAPAGDPVASGLVSSLARPGGNITGVSGIATELGPKSMELIREFLPAARRVGILSNANDPLARILLEQYQQGANATNLAAAPIIVRSVEEVESAFVTWAKERADAIILSGTLPLQLQADLALKYRMPTLQNQTAAAYAGGLITYSASYKERARQIAAYVDRILEGAKPAELPVQQPTMFDLVINLKTAKALSLTISSTLLARANEVIE
jgi:putative ABC transport system substrate-binding protein